MLEILYRSCQVPIWIDCRVLVGAPPPVGPFHRFILAYGRFALVWQVGLLDSTAEAEDDRVNWPRSHEDAVPSCRALPLEWWPR